MDVAAGAGAEEVEVVGAMFPGPDGEPPPGVTAAAAALRSRQPAAFSLRLPLQPSVHCPQSFPFQFLSFFCACHETLGGYFAVNEGTNKQTNTITPRTQGLYV